jgi:hypothetical protein
MIRKDFGGLLVLMVLSGFMGAAFNSWLTGASPAHAQPVPDGATRYGAADRHLHDVEEQLRQAIQNRTNAPQPDQQLALPNGVVTARAFQFTDEVGEVQAILTTGRGPKGPQIHLMDGNRQTIWTAPDGVAVRLLQ